MRRHPRQARLLTELLCPVPEAIFRETREERLSGCLPFEISTSTGRNTSGTSTLRMILPHFRGRPNKRDDARGVSDGETEAKKVHGRV